MLKTLFNSLLIFTLLLCTIVAFAWTLNYVENNQFEWNNHFIPTVQADYTPSLNPPIKSQSMPVQQYEPALKPSVLPKRNQLNHRIEVRFPPDAESLSVDERKKLDGILKTLTLSSSQEVHILATPAPLKRDSLSSSHAAKLRAQSIARVVYPYTQHIDISYHPDMKPNRVIIQFP